MAIHPWLGPLLPSIAILLVGFVLLTAARRRPGVVAAFIGLVVATGLGAIRYGAVLADEDFRAGALWFGAGLGLVTLGVPAWMLVILAREPNGPAVGWADAAELARVVLGYLSDPFWRKRSDREPQLAELTRLVRVLVGYLSACWLFALAIALLVFFATTDPARFR